jgi:hypothetical protein
LLLFQGDHLLARFITEGSAMEDNHLITAGPPSLQRKPKHGDVTGLGDNRAEQ